MKLCHSLKELIQRYITIGTTKSSTNLLDTKTSQNTIQSKVYRWFQLMYSTTKLSKLIIYYICS